MRIAVLLGGCGHYDGTDVHEAVLTLLALEAAGEKPLLLAPDIPLERTVDHLSGEESAGEPRNVLRESARLSRSPVRPLSEARPDDLEALIIPGGYGPVVNFSTGFARREAEHRVRPEIEAFVRHFLDSAKPIGLVSVAQILVRKLLGLEIEMSAPPPEPTRLAVDRERRIVHTPGFEGFARLGEVRAGIEAMVSEVLRLVAERGRRPDATIARQGP